MLEMTSTMERLRLVHQIVSKKKAEWTSIHMSGHIPVHMYAWMSVRAPDCLGRRLPILLVVLGHQWAVLFAQSAVLKAP